MAQFDVVPKVFRTPKGLPAVVYVRDSTNDFNTAFSAMNEDEYGLADLRLSGLALDIGGHIGTVSLSLALDNPGLRVLALEPLPENIALAHGTLEMNRVIDRVTVISAMAGRPGRGQVRYWFTNSETALHHAFIGNSTLAVPEGEHRIADVPSYGLREIVEGYCDGEIPSFMKIDCEGGEYDFLAWSQDIVGQVPLIVGEWHPNAPDDGHKQRERDFLPLLAATHDVTFTGPVEGPGGFRAVRR